MELIKQYRMWHNINDISNYVGTVLDSVVVFAHSEEEAKQILPCYFCTGFDDLEHSLIECQWPKDPKDIQIKLIGYGLKDDEPGVAYRDEFFKKGN